MIVAPYDAELIAVTNAGKVFKMSTRELIISPGSELLSVQNLKELLSYKGYLLDNDEHLVKFIYMDEGEYHKDICLLFCTKYGIVKKVPIAEFKHVRAIGKIAILLKGNDSVRFVNKVSESDEILLASEEGLAVRFQSNELRKTGRLSSGVKGIKLTPDTGEVISSSTTYEGLKVFVVDEQGTGKLTDIDKFKLTVKAVRGVIAYKLNDSDKLIACTLIKGDEEIVFLTNKHNVLRLPVSEIAERSSRICGGVRLIKLDEGEKVMLCAKSAAEKTFE
ncbi:DNA gyrase C-terminal domain protein [Candidatus Mycoplasma haematolamae str. Purdue]|uniref:DNA gyrase C-terminal domain protein n=1 Tax=Mycoplasma haematolamae (strain Purdue) TaxID=1212765 RepID=I7BB22_MYCHA|nr:DNA gyrase C-terminal beta-propeller domain-containing protein [Candidatus Mycoplasma haematolamae]AFO52495.1 DNA gyrase C-terminal domain protein [Candidatus Mycoplasma haematolamae str. Purdue]